MIALAAIAASVGALAGTPGITLRTYRVAGDTIAAIRASLDAAGPVDRNDGERVEALTHWRYTWRWPGGRACRLDAARVSVAATVTLPRLVGLATAPPDVAATWSRYRAALEEHEARHVHYARAHRGEVLAAIRGATCATADAAAQAVVRRLVEHDIAYDRDTHHGASEGAVFP